MGERGPRCGKLTPGPVEGRGTLCLPGLEFGFFWLLQAASRYASSPTWCMSCYKTTKNTRFIAWLKQCRQQASRLGVPLEFLFGGQFTLLDHPFDRGVTAASFF